jgi:hypothetical protein
MDGPIKSNPPMIVVSMPALNVWRRCSKQSLVVIRLNWRMKRGSSKSDERRRPTRDIPAPLASLRLRTTHMIEHWHGAQWVLLTYWLLMTLVVIGLRAAGLTNNPPKISTWGYWFTVETVSRAMLFIILWWGGFWS